MQGGVVTRSRVLQSGARAILHPGAVGRLLRRWTGSRSPVAPVHHDKMPVLFSSAYTVPLPPRHRFPMQRYEAVHSLMSRVLPPHMQILESLPMPADLLHSAHCRDWVQAYTSGTLTPQQERDIGFPWSPAFVHRTLCITGGTLQALAWALQHPAGVAGNLAGGTHHAFADRGEGFCIFNDLAVACQLALRCGHARHVAVVDLDVHQGNGTAAMLTEEPQATTLSVHADRNYPWSTRRPSTVDVALPDATTGEEYLAAVQHGLHSLQVAWEERGLPPPDLVLYQAGVDPLQADRLGKLSLNRTTLHDRNDLVMRWVRRLDKGRGCATPLVVTMGGGYSVPIHHSVRAHVDVFAQAGQLHKQRQEAGACAQGAGLAAASVVCPGGGFNLPPQSTSTKY